MKGKEQPKQSSRPTIGLLITSVQDPRDSLVWAGALEAAREGDANLICFPGGYADTPNRVLYDLISSTALDGVVIQLYSDREGFLEIYRKFGGLPVVNVLRLYEGYPGVAADDYQGMRDTVQHLIETHGYQRIAFIQGPENRPVSAERYRAYVDVLAEHGRRVDPSLVVGGRRSGHFTVAAGVEAVAELLDERGVAVEAIVASADSVARGVLSALDERGLRVPYDVAVTGFDDVLQSQFTVPPLTTVAQPWKEMGRRATGLLLSQLAGEEVPEQTMVPCDLVPRQSCGCWSSAVAGAGSDDRAIAGPQHWERQRVLSEMADAVDGGALGSQFESAELLLDAFVKDVESGTQGAFLPTLDTILRRGISVAGGLLSWQRALSVLQREALRAAWIDSKGADLLGRGRLLVAEMAMQAQMRHESEAASQATAMRQAGQALSAARSMAQLAEAAIREVPRLGVPGLYLSLYERPDESTEWSRMVLAFDSRGSIGVGPGRAAQRFQSRQFVPPGTLDAQRRYEMVAQPLYTQDGQHGFMLCELGPLNSPIYDSLREQFSGALRGLILVEQSDRHTLQLQTAVEVGRAASSTQGVNPDDLMQRVVDLVLNRLDLYYAGIFLVDGNGDSAVAGEPGKWAVLRAGTGQAGRQMLAQGHKLEVGGSSMIGQCIARGRGRIALDVGQEAVRFDNPLLPHTRSELALPLSSRGQVIGAMTIQSALPSAFSRQDIDALRLMADQLANAIETSRLFLASQEAVERIQTLYETSRVLSSTLDEASLMRAVLQGISQRMGCEYAIISVVDEEARTMESRHGLWQGEYDVFPEWMEMSRYSLDEPDILVDVYRSGQVEIISGWDDRFNREIYERFGHERLLRIFMPIQLRDRVTGVIEVAYDRSTKGHIGDDETQLLGAFVDQAAVALENARLLSQTQRALEETETLYTASQRLASAGGAQEMVAAIAEGVRMDAVDRVVLWSAERDGRDEIEGFVSSANWHRSDGPRPLPVGVRFPLAQFPAARLALGADALFFDDVLADERVDEVTRADLAQQDVRALALLPVWSGQRQLALLMVVGQAPHAFAVGEKRLLESLVGQMVVGLERLNLLTQAQERLRHEQILREVTDRVRSSVDVETVMRTAVQEAGRALGRTAFIYLGSEEELHMPKAPKEG